MKNVPVETTNSDYSNATLITVEEGEPTITVWIESEDGEASAEFNKQQFDAMIAAAYTLMGWSKADV